MEIDEIRWAINSNNLSDSRQLGDILIGLLQHIERLEDLIKSGKEEPNGSVR